MAAVAPKKASDRRPAVKPRKKARLVGPMTEIPMSESTRKLAEQLIRTLAKHG